MHSQTSCSNTKLEKAMSTEQFTQIVDAILAGKYSWACVLLLRFSGYNPLHYIPYRTYNRLLKENCQVGKRDKQQTPSVGTINQPSESKITDLAYLEVVGKQASVRGGNRVQGFGKRIRECLLKLDVWRY